MYIKERIEILLDNPKLMETYGYSLKDIKDLNLRELHSNQFIQFIKDAIPLMNNQSESVRIAANKITNLLRT